VRQRAAAGGARPPRRPDRLARDSAGHPSPDSRDSLPRCRNACSADEHAALCSWRALHPCGASASARRHQSRASYVIGVLVTDMRPRTDPLPTFRTMDTVRPLGNGPHPKFGPSVRLVTCGSGPHPKFGPSVRLVTCGSSLLRLKPASFVSSWHLVAQSRVRALRIVLHSPGSNGSARFLKGAKPVLIQALLPKPGVEGLDKWMIRRRPWPAESQLYAMAMRPGIQRLGRELRTMIDKERLRQPMCRGQPLKHGHYPLATQGSIDLDRWTPTTHVIHSR
jgi:hypothetical protein